MDLRQIHTEDVFDSLLGPVLMSRSKIKGQGHQGQKCAVHSHYPPAATEWNALAANSVIQQHTGPFRRCR